MPACMMLQRSLRRTRRLCLRVQLFSPDRRQAVASITKIDLPAKSANSTNITNVNVNVNDSDHHIRVNTEFQKQEVDTPAQGHFGVIFHPIRKLLSGWPASQIPDTSGRRYPDCIKLPTTMAEPAPASAGTAVQLRPKLSELAAQISANAKIVEDYIEAQGLPYPSFATDGPSNFPIPENAETAKIHEARQELLTASKRIYDLATGPNEYLRWLVWNYNDVSTLHVVTAFDIPNIVPLDGDISYAEIGKQCNVPELKIRRVLRLAMTNRIFYEPRHGYVAHTAASKLLRDDLMMRNWISYNTDDLAPASLKVVEALQKWPESGETSETAFALANGGESLFQFLGTRPERAKRFGTAMSAFSTGQGYAVEHLVNGYDWDKLPKDATIVDVGGATGFVSVELAKTHPDFKFVVEDKVKAQLDLGEAQLEEALKPRFEYRVHDFFTEQPVKDADVYLIRWCMHNWSDKYALIMLKSLVPALKNGSKVIINELALPEPNTSNPWAERRIRTLDMVMMMCLNALEREEGDWERLFAEADPRFRFDGVKQPPGCLMNIVEATFVAE
ncbi:O-demethylpuromycin-O-methyltransferase [Drechslerella dactyloides]|uniref:O-demethylpuromycin-O-methyltransferase n=1 Tax=Drechslerella dactyloides TaxID=74499 RepID=A0AAD6NK30_DREDA|nr:O-demethylpuromycin-O-methyltransferase [Drechslerella dactyloides]